MTYNHCGFKKLTGGYKDNPIFSDLSASFKKSMFTAIAGPNGSGKSTLLKYLIKELPDYNNAVYIADTTINSLDQKQLAKYISFVPQFGKTSYEFTVKEVVAFGRYCHGDNIKDNNRIIDDSIKLVGIESIENKYITQISGGEFQLTMLARAICQKSDIILLDEPINNLDPKHQIKLLELLKELQCKGKTVICVMHDLNLISRYADETVLMKKGQIKYFGKTEDILTKEILEEIYEIKVSIIPSHDRFPSTIYYSL